MKRYDTYKDSGVQWLGEIPGHWEMRKMKYIFDERSEKNHPNEPMLSATQSEGVILQSKYQGRVVVVNTGFEGLKLVKDGDFVIHLRSFQGGIEYAYDRGIISAAYTILNPKYPEFSAYYKRLFKSSSFIDLLKICVTGIREGQNINYSKLKQFFIPLPPLSEQRSIVSFLDAKCGKIDEWVTKKQKEVEHLQELKQRVIADAVTRGLNPHVKMKATNILWIKEIPEHWEIKRLKYLVSCNDESLTNTENPNLEINYVEIGDVNDINGIAHITKYRFEDAPSRARRKTRKDDVIVSTVRTYLKAIAKVPDNGIIVSTGFAVLRAIDVNSSYLAFCCISSNFIDSVVALSKGISYPAITASELLNLFIPVPPLSEQKQIVSYLDTKCSKIEKLIANINKEIERIKEYKQRLISDVVTGQIKVN